jgi:DNA-binding SARP family transcriptional activator/TolB-like protein
MISFRALGPSSLTGHDGQELRSVVSQPGCVALLAVLAMRSPGGFHRRDMLVGLLWSDADEERARGSLRQALHHLGRSLGEGVIVSRGDEEIGLAPGALWCDAVEFEKALAEDRPEDALALYRGDLLEGFFVADAPEFERWLEPMRARLRDRASAAALALAERATQAGEWARAGEWAALAARVAPGDERVARRIGAVRQAWHADGGEGDRAVAVLAPPVQALSLEDTAVDLSPHAADEIRTEDAPAPAGARRWWRRAPALAAGVVGAAALWGGARLVWPARPATGPDDVVAVLPFRTRGADPSLGYLREGMVDLLAAKLDGERGPRALSPQTLIQRWRQAVPSEQDDLSRDEAVRVSEDLGATQLLLGGVAGTPQRLVLNAQVVAVPGGRVVAEGSVRGPADSVPALVDRLAAQLLMRGAGEAQGRYGALTSTSVPALKAYLAGQSAYRRGAYADAVRSFDAALQQDSLLAVAALGLASASIASNGVWTGGDVHARALPRVWALRDRLTPRDRTFLVAVAGPRYPERTPMAEHLEAWERAVDADPGRPEAWYELGDMYFHSGAVLGIHDAHERAAAAFRRALAVDSTLVTPLQHLADLAIMDGDTASARRYASIYLARHPQGDAADFVRWRAAAALHDPATLAALRGRMDRMGAQSLFRIVSTGQTDADYLADVERAVTAFQRRGSTVGERWTALKLQMSLALNQGRPAQAERVLARMDEMSRSSDVARDDPLMVTPDRWRVLAALYWDGDAAAGQAAYGRLERALGAIRDTEAPVGPEQARDLCVAEQWKIWHGTAAQTRRAVRVLARHVDGEPDDPSLSDRRWCAQLLSTLVTAMDESPGADVALSRFDALMRTGPRPAGFVGVYGNLVLARLYERRGEIRSALAAARRRWDVPFFVSSYLRMEGELAARMGDAGGSARAYRRFLNLRESPEPALAAEAADLRGRLPADQP